jgi:hypothetical protein
MRGNESIRSTSMKKKTERREKTRPENKLYKDGNEP